jgi:hypothetical protein
MNDLRTHCPPLFAFPTKPFAFGHLRPIYTWNQTFEQEILPEYLCYSEQFCERRPESIELRLSTDPSELLLCQPISKIHSSLKTLKDMTSRFLEEYMQCSMKDNDTVDLCRQTNVFHCGKKCISKHRLVDGFKDCFDKSDETFNDSCALPDKYRLKPTYIDNVALCYKSSYLEKHVNKIGYIVELQAPHFPTICDGYREFQEEPDTDETDCHHWPCDNQYTRCDNVWNCPNGKDEVRCSYSPCGLDEHPCLSMNTTRLICLPLSQVGDGNIDCWGAADERQICREPVGNVRYLCRQKSTNVSTILE